MAEIEPLPGASGPPPETPPVATAPVETGPVAGVGPAGAAPPPTRPKGLVRWGVALLTLAVMVGAVSVAVALLAGGPGTSSVEAWLPKDTVLYVEVRADLPGDQRAKMGDLLAKFPGFADQASNDAKIDEALDRILEKSGASWTGDLKPWVGGEVGLAVTGSLFDLAVRAQSGATPTAMPDDGLVVLASVKDAGAAKAWLAKNVDGTQTTETYAGGELTRVVDGRTVYAFAVRSNVLLLGPEKTVKAALDTAGASSVAKSEAFAAAHATAPEAYLGFGYIDYKAFADFVVEASRAQGGSTVACLEKSMAAVPAWLAGSARAEDDALVLLTTSQTVGTPPTAKGTPSGVAARLPGTTIAAFEARAFGPSLVAGIDVALEQLACDPSTAATIAQVKQGLAALGGMEALVGWAGDTALAVTVDGSTVGGGLAALTTDEAAAKRTLAQLQTLLALGGAQAGIGTREEKHGEATLLVLTLPASAGSVPDIAATVHDGVFALGTIDFVRAVVDTEAASSLAKDAVYQRAIERAGGDGLADVFVDIAGLRAGIEAMLPASEKARYETEVKPFLVPFEAFAMVAEAPGATSESRVVITFTK